MTTIRRSESWTLVEVNPRCGIYRWERAWDEGERLLLDHADARRLAHKGTVTVVGDRATGPKARYI